MKALKQIEPIRRIVQVYKSGTQWKRSPPGFGDFVRGTCTLHERFSKTVDLRVDLSHSDFERWIDTSAPLFCRTTCSLDATEEFFTGMQHRALETRIAQAIASDASFEMAICTNIGSWATFRLPRSTRSFAKPLFNFRKEVTSEITNVVRGKPYEIVSVRCGDEYFADPNRRLDPAKSEKVFQILEKEILPRARRPIVLISDCWQFKKEASQRYGLLSTALVPQHGSGKEAFSTCVDIGLVKGAKFSYHINLAYAWWSGFVHFTALIFQIPGANFRYPDYECKEVRFSVPPLQRLRTLPRSILRRLRAVSRGRES